VVILSSLIRKKASELPFLAKDDLVEKGDDLYFCSSTCYMQFALMHRSPSVSEDKVSSIQILDVERCKGNSGYKTQLQSILHHKYLIYLVWFEVLMAASMKLAVFCVVALCSLVEVYQRYRGPCCLYHQGDDDRGSKDL
jgi:hypothetical protein